MSDPQDAAKPSSTDAAPSLDLLLSRLADTDPYVRTWAAIDLRKRNDPRAIPALFEAVDDPDRDVHEEVALALEAIIPDDDVPNLFRLASLPKEERGEPNSYAITAYGKLRIHQAQAVAYLASSLSDADIAARRSISTNLEDHVRYLSSASSGRYRDDGQIPPEAEQRIVALLQPLLERGLADASSTVRAACATALENTLFHSEAIYHALLPLLHDSEACVRQSVASALHRFPRSLSDLKPYLHDEQVATRVAAIPLVPRELDAESIDALVAAGMDCSDEVRLAVAEYVASYLNRQYLSLEQSVVFPNNPRLIQILQCLMRDSCVEIRDYVAKQISSFWLYELTNRYLDALANGNEGAREVALHVLPGIRKHRRFALRLDMLFQKADTNGRVAILTLISQLNSNWRNVSCKQIITGGLHDSDATVRRVAIQVAGQPGGSSMRRALESLVNDHDATVAETARQTLRQMDERLTCDSIAAGLREPSWEKRQQAVLLIEESQDPRCYYLLCEAFYDSDCQVRRDALLRAQTIADDRVIDALKCIAKDENDLFIRCLAIQALGRCGTLIQVPLLLPMLREKSHRIRIDAIQALSSITGQSFDDDIDAWEGWWKTQEEHAGDSMGSSW